jgi:hypothetical protein
METIDDLIEHFKKNMERGYQAALLYNGHDTVTLSCDPRTSGYVGFLVLKKQDHTNPNPEKTLDK